MSMPFYVPPEQLMKDRADYARNGIARGKTLVALEYVGGIVIVAENPSKTLHKVSEIYDRIAFAGVGKYNEFQALRVAGVRHADVTGFTYSREDVNAEGLASAYAQQLGQVFTHDIKPFEVEILVCQVGTEADDSNQMFHILYDGTVMDESGFTALGGDADSIDAILKNDYNDSLSLKEAVLLGTKALADEGEPLKADQLEVAVLERALPRRAFRRITGEELASILSE